MNHSTSSHWPTLSIVTPTFNSEVHLLEAVESIDIPVLEQVIVDGGSTDATLGLAARLPRVRVLPGPDQGIYDAFNKGLRAARGEIVGFLNSDDRYPAGALAAVLDCFARNPDAAVVSGEALVFSADARGERIIAHHRDPALNALTPENLMRQAPIINARFFRRSVLEILGGFVLDYPLASDREWLIRLALRGERTHYLARPLYEYRAHPGSSTLAGTPLAAARVASENFRLAEALIAQWRDEPALRHAALAWHADTVITAVVAACRLGRWSAIPQIFERASRQNRLWYLRLPLSVAQKLLARRRVVARP